MKYRVLVRAVLATILVLSTSTLASSYVTHVSQAGGSSTFSTGLLEDESSITGPRDDITVVTRDPPGFGNGTGAIVAVAPDGSELYFDERYDQYFDVDPIPEERASVLFVAGERLEDSACPRSRYNCIANHIVRVNLTTGDQEVVFSRLSRRWWHDVDMIDDSTFVVADIGGNRVFVLNTSSGLVEWGWDARNDFSIQSGGTYPFDWTHLNDVEVLDDGRIMVSLRNQDQVVFLDRQSGLQENWTLGEDDNHTILYEQHNPDYIPAERGGPAVLVADSEKGRVVEYQRRSGEWKQTWMWTDTSMQWPRDADRLPNGHTLIVDSNGNRVFEIDEQGDIVWEMRINTPYDAERLGTGDESAGGASAERLGLRSRGEAPAATTAGDGAEAGGETVGGFVGWIRSWVVLPLKKALPSLVVNSLLFVLPPWIALRELVALLGLIVVGILWPPLEIWWSDWIVDIRVSKE